MSEIHIGITGDYENKVEYEDFKFYVNKQLGIWGITSDQLIVIVTGGNLQISDMVRRYIFDRKNTHLIHLRPNFNWVYSGKEKRVTYYGGLDRKRDVVLMSRYIMYFGKKDKSNKAYKVSKIYDKVFAFID